MSGLRLLFLGPNLAAGGAQRHWSILVPGLRARGHDARLVALDAGGSFVEPIRATGVPVEVWDMRHQADLWPVLRSPMVRRFKPQMVISRGVSGMYVGQAIASWRGAGHVVNEHLGRGLVLTPRRERMLRALARRIDLVIAVSPDQRDAWLTRGTPSDRIAVVPNGVLAAPPRVDRAAARSELGVSESDVVVVLVAALRPEKRVEEFVAAVLEARRTEPRILGLVVGDGAEREAVARAAAGADGVRLLGHRDDVERILGAADIFALSSRFEAAPMAILEAMAVGLPVVATAVGAIPEIVAHEQSGLLVPPGRPDEMAASLVRLAGDRHLRRAMGAHGARRHRQDWDAEVMIDRYAALLERAAASRSPAPG